MAIVFAILCWKHYLIWRQFIVRTDQISLKHILKQREIGVEYQKWALKLLGYHFVIMYTPRRTNIMAYALSRRGPELCTSISTISIDWDKLTAEVTRDSILFRICKDIEEGRRLLWISPYSMGNYIIQGDSCWPRHLLSFQFYFVSIRIRPLVAMVGK